MRNILVIRLGALGDFIESFPAFQAIRCHHRRDHITLLTTPTFARLAERSPWFDEIVLDRRRPWFDVKAQWSLWRKLSPQFPFACVYDLQTSSRTALYSYVIKTHLWSGHVRRSNAPRVNPWRADMHVRARQAQQLAQAGVPPAGELHLSWLYQGHMQYPPSPYIVLVPGCSPSHPYKGWPAPYYRELAIALKARGYQPVIVGTRLEKEIAREICAGGVGTDLSGCTDLFELATLMRGACYVVGNDTGPVHLAAMVGQRCIVVFSKYSVPQRMTPLGHRVGQVDSFWVDDLASLSPHKVVSCLLSHLGEGAEPRNASDNIRGESKEDA